MWAFFGHDEPNYTYMKDGRKLLSELAELSPVPVFMRTHNLLTTGDGTPALKWGSTNAYTEDADGRPKYDWTIVDRIFDTYMQRHMKPLVQIGFMPEALSSNPVPYQHDWAAGNDKNHLHGLGLSAERTTRSGASWCTQWVQHAVAKYGKREVESWYWEVWNEPDIGYWHGTPEEYQQALRLRRGRRQTGAADGAGRRARSHRPERRADAADPSRLPRALPAGHELRDRQDGSPLDFITFHAKGAPRDRRRPRADGHQQSADAPSPTGSRSSRPSRSCGNCPS